MFGIGFVVFAICVTSFSSEVANDKSVTIDTENNRLALLLKKGKTR